MVEEAEHREETAAVVVFGLFVERERKGPFTDTNEYYHTYSCVLLLMDRK